jgi:LacI family transcriptional regulator
VPPTLVDIAKETGTSVSTVSRVLAGGAVAERISDNTRSRVIKVARQMGYRPNLLARGLRTRKTQTVALLVSDIANPFFGQIASVVEQRLRRDGYSLMICNSYEDPELEDEYLNLLPRKGIDGLIVVPLSRGKRTLTEALPPDLPLVVIDRPVSGITASVSSDEVSSANALCDTLAREGVKTAAIICGPQNIYTHRLRCETVRDRFKIVATATGVTQHETGRNAFPEGLPSRVDAVICTNNFLAMGFIESIEDVKDPPVIGVFDEIPMMQQLPFPIVCAMQDIPMLAEGCVRQLLPQMRGERGALEPMVLPTRIVTNRAFHHLRGEQAKH